MRKHIKEEAAGGGATTEGDIAYLPGGGSTIKAAIQSLSKVKDDWDMQILEHPKKKRVSFEKQLNISVLNNYWSDFTKDVFGKDIQSGMISLNKFLKESVEDDLLNLKSEAKVKLFSLFQKKIFKRIEGSVVTWTRVFGIKELIKQDCAIRVLSKKKDIKKFVDQFLEKYGEDKGMLEMFIDTIDEGGSINKFMSSLSLENLYGQRITSEYSGISLIFCSYVDFMYEIKQYIYVNREEVLDEVQADFKDVSIEGKTIYPKGGCFNMSFFSKLKDIIAKVEEDIITDKEKQNGNT